MSKERPAGHSGKNKVNEFDQDAWSSVFDTMTKEREEQESAEAISSREAMQAVKQMLENLQDKCSTEFDAVMSDMDVLRSGLEETGATVKEINERINDTSYLDRLEEGVPPSK